MERRLRAHIDERTGLDIAKAGGGIVRRHAHRHDGVRPGGGAGRIGKHPPERGHIAHQMVGGQDGDDGVFAAQALGQSAGRRDGGGRVAAARLAHDVGARQFGKLAARGGHERVRRDDQYPLGRHQAGETVHRLPNERLAAEDRKELLRTIGRRERPEALAATAGKNDRVEVADLFHIRCPILSRLVSR